MAWNDRFGGGPSAASIASGGYSGYGGLGREGTDGATGRGGFGGQFASAAALSGKNLSKQGQEFGKDSSFLSNIEKAALGTMALGILIPPLAPALEPLSFALDYFSLIPKGSRGRSTPGMMPTIETGPQQETDRLPSISTLMPKSAGSMEAVEPMVDPMIDNAAFNKQLMDMYFNTLSTVPSGGGRGIRGAGLPGYKQQQRQTADEWLNKYWRK